MMMTKEGLRRLLVQANTLEASQTDGKLMNLTKVLVRNNLEESPDLLYADLDLTTMTFTVDNPEIIDAWNGPFLSQATGLYALTADADTIVCATNPDSDTIYGYALVDATGPAVLIGYERFEEPWTPSPDHAMIIVARLGLAAPDDSPRGDVTFV